MQKMNLLCKDKMSERKGDQTKKSFELQQGLY